jgi:Xaa-Pro aminopeptidase
MRLVERRLLDRDEASWLDAYHARVRKALAPLVDAPTRAWLKNATKPLAAAAK